MPSASQTALDSSPSQEKALSKSPVVVILTVAAFLSALASGWSLARLLARGEQVENRRVMLSGGTLAILHAIEEAELTTQALAAHENTELSTLTESIGKLKTQLTELDNQVAEAQKKVADFDKFTGDAETRRKGFITEKQQMDVILEKFIEADAEHAQYEETLKTVMAQTGDTLSPETLGQWKRDREKLTADASSKVERARTTLNQLKTKQNEWNTGKEKFTPDQQKTVQKQLRALFDESKKDLEEARAAVNNITTPLQEMIAAQRKQLRDAVQSMAKD
jgi:hypothetical protein